MKGPSEHVDSINKSISEWLQPDNKILQESIERTVDEGLFSFEDIKHQILALKYALKPANIEQWIRQSGIKPNSLANRTVLCLHAGNLPLVGLQDLLAVIISGANYAGKLSKKDPYLLKSLIRTLDKQRLVKQIQCSTELEVLYGVRPDAWLFSGSEKNATAVENLLIEQGAINPDSPSLIRTAFYSAAYIDNLANETMAHLTEAVFRYGGAGCRSVAVVVSPFGLNEIKCEFTDYIESFWLKNPQHQNPPKSLEHRFAMNKAIGVNQAWLNDFIIEEGAEVPGKKFILTWLVGDFSAFSQFVTDNKRGLQSVYSTADYIGNYAGDSVIEPLSAAQKPPIWWRPDNIDTLSWLHENISCEDP